MENMMTASPAKGLGLLRKANVLAIVALVLSIVSGIVLFISGGAGVGMALAGDTAAAGGMLILAGITGIVGLAGVVLILTSSVMEIVALAKISGIHAGYKNAMLLVIAGLVVPLITIAPLTTVALGIVDAIGSIISLLAVCCVVGASVELLKGRGDTVVSAKGMQVRTIYVICTVIMLVAELAGLVPALATMSSLVTMITAIVQMVAVFKYIGFLGEAAKAL